jgi:hypothetical protein
MLFCSLKNFLYPHYYITLLLFQSLYLFRLALKSSVSLSSLTKFSEKTSRSSWDTFPSVAPANFADQQSLS